ncbi:hypothetical protein AgCh_030455 [Apium graveolens]
MLRAGGDSVKNLLSEKPEYGLVYNFLFENNRVTRIVEYKLEFEGSVSVSRAATAAPAPLHLGAAAVSSNLEMIFAGDLQIESLSLTFNGLDLIVDFEWQDFLGLNGCGKYTLLTDIRHREIPIPEHMDIFYLTREIEASDMSSLETVINYDQERTQLEKEVEVLDCQDSPMLEPTKRYLKLISLDAPTVLLSLAMQGVFRGFKDTTTPLYATVVGDLENIVLDPKLIFVYHMGVSGATIIHVLSQ